MSDQPETFRGHIPALAGSIVGTLISAVIGSHLFASGGAVYGLMIGSTISGTASWWGERAIRRGQAIATAKMKAERNRGRPLSPDETQRIERVHGRAFDLRNRGIPYRTILSLTAVAVFVCVGTVVTLTALGARQVATFTPVRSTPAPSPVVVTPTVTAAPLTTTATPTLVITPSSSATETPTASPDPSPDASPAIISSTESATPAPETTTPIP